MFYRPVSVIPLLIPLLLFVSSPSHGMPIPSGGESHGYQASDIGATFSAGTGGTSPTVAYDALSRRFTMDAELGRVGDFGVIREGSTVRANDLIGQFSLTAMINSAGQISSGSFSWIGQSAALGITAPSILMQGRSVDALTTTAGAGIDVLAIVDLVHPGLEALLGPVNTLLIETFALGRSIFDGDPWDNSYSYRAATSGPDLSGSAKQIPGPASLLVFAIGLAGLALLRRPTVQAR